MNPKFHEYLKAIGVPETISKDRIEKIYQFYTKICPQEINGIFVTDYVNQEGSTQYENLWFFSEKYQMEAHDFIAKDDFDMTGGKIVYWNLAIQDYDFKTVNPSSRMTLDFRYDHEIKGELKSSKENCRYLYAILQKHLLPGVI